MPASACSCRAGCIGKRELSRVSFLVLRDRAGLAQVVIERRARTSAPETVLEVEGLAVANEQAPGGVEVHEPADPRPRRAGRAAAGRAAPAGAAGVAADAARRGCGRASPSGGARALPAHGACGRCVSLDARRARLRRDPDAEDRRLRDRGRRERLLASTTSGARRSSRRARSSTSRRWSASSSGSTRSGPSSAPSRTRRDGISPSTSRSTPSSASSATTAT